MEYRYKYEQEFKSLFPDADWEPSGNSNYLTNCPFHHHLESKTFAIDFETGLWHCFNPDCGVSGKGAKYLEQLIYRHQCKEDFEMALVTGRQLDEEMLQWLEQERGISEETVRKYHLAQKTEEKKHWLTGLMVKKKYLLIPIYDRNGELVAGREYLLPAYRDENDAKIKFAWPKSPVTLYPVSSLQHDTIIVTEGELDALLLNQYGIPTVTTTAGAGAPFERFADSFRGKTVYFCFDCDRAGRDGAKKAAETLARQEDITVYVMDLGLGEGEDVTDFFVKYGRTKDNFLDLMKQVVPVTCSKPLELPMSSIGTEHINKPFLVKARVLGEAGIHKFVWPQHNILTCSGGNLEVCDVCPLQSRQRFVTIHPNNPMVINLMEKPPDKQKAFIAALADIPYVTQTRRCMRWTFAEDSKMEMAVPVFIESSEEDVPDAKKELAGYVTTEKAANALRSGKEAQFWLTPVQDTQKDGKLMFIAEEVIPLQDDLDTFRMTENLHEKLKTFQGNPFQKIPEIASSLNKNVFRIRGREELLIAYDLIYHSIIGIPNPNAPGRTIKGWAELLIVGDPGEGKSQLVMELQNYYGLGAIQDAAIATPGGLTVTTVQMGGKWIFRDGLLPLNDRRLVVIDEFNKIPSEDLGRLNTSRASGKITASSSAGTYEKDARVRLIWITNQKDGQRIDVGRNAGSFPIEMVAELFPDRGAQDRLDLAVLVLRDDQKPEFDTPPQAQEDSTYTKHLCRSLVLWAWTRRPDQVHFTEDAVREVRLASDRLRRMFWHPDSDIELINSGERTTERIIRLAAAVAARTYSTADGENLFITAEHVRFIEEFLKAQYKKFEFDVYIRALQAKHRAKPKDFDETQLDEQKNITREVSKALVLRVLQEDRLFYDMLDSGKYDLGMERKFDNRNVLGWLYANGYVRTDDARHFKFTKAFYQELEQELEETVHVF